MGETDWVCDSLTPVPLDLFEEFLPLPGDTDPANPIKYKQIAGASSFDEVTGARYNATASNDAAVFVLTEGVYFCMLAESGGEAVLFDAPECKWQFDFVSLFCPRSYSHSA